MRRSLALALGIVVLSAAAACGDKGGGSTTTGGAAGGGTATGGGGAGAGPAVVGDPKSAVGRWTADTAPMMALMKPMLEMSVKMMETMGGVPTDPEAKKKYEEAKAKVADLEKMSMVMTLEKGGAASMDVNMPGEASEKVLGTWTQTGDQVTVQMKTSNGKPVEGKKAQAKTMTLTEGVLSLTDSGMTITFKRS